MVSALRCSTLVLLYAFKQVVSCFGVSMFYTVSPKGPTDYPNRRDFINQDDDSWCDLFTKSIDRVVGWRLVLVSHSRSIGWA